MEDFHFNRKVAKKLGTNCAVILHNIMHWVDFNKANNKNFYEGKYWTYNSATAFLKQFDYLTARQIRYALDKLAAEGYILIGNFNKTCDRTLWYTYTEKALNLLNGVEESINSQSQSACESILHAPKSDEKEAKQEEISTEVAKLQNCQNDVTKLLHGNYKIVNSMLQICKNDVTNLSDVPDKIPQIKNSNIKLQQEKETYKEKENNDVCVVVDFWNAQNLMPCDNITQDLAKAVRTQIKIYTLADICEYIRRYAEVLHSKFYISHQWSLRSFLTKRNAMPDFVDNGEKWLEYMRWKEIHNQDKLNDIYELYLEELKKEKKNEVNKD